MWGFLAALGQGLAKAGQGAMTGLQYAGQGLGKVGQGIGKVGQEIGQGVGTGVKQVAQIPQRIAGKLNRPELGMARTPGINPAVDVARGTTGGVPWDMLPARTGSWGGGRMAGDMMARTQAPLTQNPIGGLPLPAMDRFSVALPIERVPQVLPKPAISEVIPALASPPARSPLPQMDMDAMGKPIPRLPGRPGGPMPFDPVEKARYDYVMDGAEWESTGGLDSDPSVQQQKPRFKRSWKDSLINAGLGASQEYQRTGSLGAALGGGLAGGVGTAINPMAGREFRYDTLEAPRMEEQRQRQMERTAQDQAIRMGQLREDDIRSQIESRRARDEMAKAEADRDAKTIAAMEKAREAQARAARYKPFSNVAMFDTERGEFVPVPEGMRPVNPAQDRQLRNDIDRDIQAFEKEKSAASNPRNKNRQQAMQQHAATAQRIKELYGDAVEVGQQNGWWYVKPRLGAAQAPMMRNESDLLNLLR